MKALIKLKAEPGIWMGDVPMPSYGVNEVLIKIQRTAICGTDIHIYKWDEWAQKNIQVPMHVGHEFAGKIVEIGSEVKGFNIGDRVSGEGHITCGHCRNCRAGRRHLCPLTIGVGVNRPGAFAEYLVMPASNIIKLPDNISDDQAAIMDPLGNSVHTALSYDLAGEDVLITGAGPTGSMAAAIAKHLGARHIVVTDVNDYRLSLAKKLGATRTVNINNESLSQVVTELGMLEGFDIGLEMSGNPLALKEMISNMNNGSKVVLLGVYAKEFSFDWNAIVFKGLFIKGIYGREMFETWYKMISMLQSGLDVSPIITHHFPSINSNKASMLCFRVIPEKLSCIGINLNIA